MRTPLTPRFRALLWLGLIAVAVALSLVTSPPADASNAIARANDGLACTTCHDKPGSRLLTDKGKYYEATGSLAGFEEVNQVFGSCTSCHVRKPGSHELTRTGKRFERLAGDMQGLRDLLASEHVFPPAGDEPSDEPVEPPEN